MNQFEFDKLLEKYLSEKCTEDEIEMLNEWSEKQLEFLDHVGQQYKSTEDVKVKNWKKLKNKIETPTKINIKQVKNTRLFVVLGLLIALLSFLLLSRFKDEDGLPNAVPINNIAGVELRNTSNSSQNFSLPDGSTVTLEPSSMLKYQDNFGQVNRTIFLEGEAFFDVTKNVLKPFYVYSENLTTEVLGTSFTIKAYEDSSIEEVIVEKGTVQVYEKSTSNKEEIKKTVLSPNHKAVFNKKEKKIEKNLVDTPILIVPKLDPENFKFYDEPVKNVFEKLESYYGFEIHILDSELEKCTFTGDLNDISPIQQIKFISKVIKADLEIRGTKILITGEGCKI
jgi:ferric-dicitrate binding protein FerR (iron transport regulator)